MIADPEGLSRAQFDHYMCPQGLNTNFVSGGEYAGTHIYTSLTIERCVEPSSESDQCEDPAVIDAKID